MLVSRTLLVVKRWRRRRLLSCMLTLILGAVILNGLLVLLRSILASRCDGVWKEQPPCRYLIRNIRPRGLAEIDEADLNEEQQGGLAEIHETGLNEEEQGGLAEIHETGSNEEQQGDLAEIHETCLNEEQQGDLAEIHETGLNDGHELGLAEIHDAVLDEGQEADQVAYEQHASVSSTRRSTIHSDGQPSNTSSHEIQHDVRMRSDLASTRHLWPWGKLFGCDNLSYKTSSLASTSVIITFHDNEILTDLLHTIRSVLLRTPPQLLAEIILVDDNSQKAELKGELDRHLAVEFTSKVRLLRSATHLGLIRARLLGTRAASAQVVVCMDSHMEVAEKWLEPLLEEIRRNRRTLAASYLDWMQQKDGAWEFTHGASSWKTYFDWSFTFGFQEMSERQKHNRNQTRPVRTPITIGGIFAIETRFFRDIGEFDDGMQFWGGENIDLALRVWLFGGRVVNVPCSHAVHLERIGHRNYRVGLLHDTWTNHKRVVDVWLGDYAKYFYYYNPQAKVIDAGDLSHRVALRRKSVHDFSWFVRNVFPELGIPDVDTFAWGGVRNKGLNMCLNGSPPSYPILRTCSSSGSSQGFFWSNTGELRMPVFTMQVQPRTKKLDWNAYMPLYQTDDVTKWIHWMEGPLKIFNMNLCLQASPEFEISLEPCNHTSPLQQWSFRNYTSEWKNILQDHYVIRKSSYRKSLVKAVRKRSQESI